MRKRLRKKKYLAEFTELGFQVDFTYRLDDPAAEDELLDAFLDHAIEANDLLLFGGCVGMGEGSGYIVAEARYCSVTEPCRERVRSWLVAQECVETVTVGPLGDANNGW